MNKYEEALTYLRNSALVTDHKQKERVNQCKEVLQELIDKCIDEKGNLKVFASICIDEDKMKKICKESIENFKDQFIDSYEDLLYKNTPIKVEQVKSDSDVKIGKLTIRKGTTVIQKCPKCGGIIMKVHNKKYCGNCGQAICWGEEDE